MADRSPYVELRARSAFSFLEGASGPEDLVDCAAALGYDAIALGDRDGLYGAPRFYQAASRAGITRGYRHPAVVSDRRSFRPQFRDDPVDLAPRLTNLGVQFLVEALAEHFLLLAQRVLALDGPLPRPTPPWMYMPRGGFLPAPRFVTRRLSRPCRYCR